MRIEQSSGLIEGRDRARCARTPSRTPPRTSRSGELAELRNQADSMCFQVEKLMKEHADKLEPADKKPLEAAIAKTREAAKGDNVDAIKIGDRRAGAGVARREQGAVRGGQAAGAGAPSGRGRRRRQEARRRGRGDRRRVRGQGVTSGQSSRIAGRPSGSSACGIAQLTTQTGIAWHFASTN